MDILKQSFSRHIRIWNLLANNISMMIMMINDSSFTYVQFIYCIMNRLLPLSQHKYTMMSVLNTLMPNGIMFLPPQPYTKYRKLCTSDTVRNYNKRIWGYSSMPNIVHTPKAILLSTYWYVVSAYKSITTYVFVAQKCYAFFQGTICQTH